MTDVFKKLASSLEKLYELDSFGNVEIMAGDFENGIVQYRTYRNLVVITIIGGCVASLSLCSEGYCEVSADEYSVSSFLQGIEYEIKSLEA